MSGTSWNSVGKKHEEQRSSEGSGMLAVIVRRSLDVKKCARTWKRPPNLSSRSLLTMKKHKGAEQALDGLHGLLPRGVIAQAKVILPRSSLRATSAIFSVGGVRVTASCLSD